MLKRCFPSALVHAQTRLDCCAALQACYDEMSAWDPDTSPGRLAAACRRHLLLWAALREAADDDTLWALYPKHHLLLHTAENATTNPSLEWNYSDESEIGQAVKLAAGVNALALPVTLMQKYRATYGVACD
eukprot:8578303-Lingulodinium_polyedra.AAC.1